MARIFAALVVVFLCLTGQAHASNCAPADEILDALQLQHGEVPSYRGLLSNGNLFLVVTSPETGSFTLLVIPPQEGDLACVLAAGVGFTSMTAPPQLKGTAM